MQYFVAGRMSKISIANDHAGLYLKKEIVELLKKLGHTVTDHGCHTDASVDYPDFAKLVAHDVASGKADRGILICGTGIGMAITANKIKGIRAANVSDVFSALMTRKHNDANILCLGARVVGSGLAVLITETFLATDYEGGRHQKRVDKIEL